MSTTAVSAGQIMDRVANLLNDPNKTDYTYLVMIPYLNMAIEELSELMEESNNSPSNQTTAPTIPMPVGTNMITSAEITVGVNPHYPEELTEIQEIGERLLGTNDSFVSMRRLEFLPVNPPNNSFLYWIWEDQVIRFNPNGALTPRDIRLHYVRQGIPYVANEDTRIEMINSRAFLSYKTAALCAMFIGENESRAQTLEDQANKAADRLTSISNKGRQQIMTRHRPFRAAYKSRGFV